MEVDMGSRILARRFLCIWLLVLAASSAIFAQQGAGAIVAIEEGGGGGVQQGGGKTTSGGPAVGSAGKKAVNSSRQSGAKAGTKAAATTSKVVTAPSKPRPYKGPVLGDKYSFLNFEVAEPVQPVYTNAAKAAGAKGLVQVEILVDTDGRVIDAHARTGNKL